MKKREIVGLFLEKGLLLSPEEFEKMNEENYKEILEDKTGGEKKDESVVAERKEGKISPEEFIKIYNEKFEFLRGILLKKTEAVSINKGRKVFSEVAIIGRVKELTAKGFVVEDVTGETEVVGENEGVNTGDVLGMKGFFKENCFFPKQIIWPDIPLGNNPEPPETKIMLTTKAKENVEGIMICPDAKPSKNVITGFDGLGTIKISKGEKDIRVIAYSRGKETSEEEAVGMLKKRMIPEEGVADNLIAEIPDILWLFNNKKNWSRNYRGIVIASSDENSFVEYVRGEIRFGKT